VSWYQLLDIRKQGRLEFEMDPTVIGPPTACPNDGEPLQPGPPSDAGIWFCKYDGWQWPRDWNRPEPPAGLYDGIAEAPGSYSGIP
jgi:hypothetical protein